jgi:hypothetical protein
MYDDYGVNTRNSFNTSPEQAVFYKLYRNSSKGEYAYFKNIPIILLNDFKKAFKNDIEFRIRYRGPRAHNVKRYSGRKQSTCLKKDAERFSVYVLGFKN